MKRIAVGSLSHESNNFTPIKTTEADFLVVRGAEIYSHLDSYPPVKGLIHTLQQYGYTVEPTVFARALPGGEVEEGFYKQIRNELLDRLKGVKELDAIALVLHGSMRVENMGDAEGDLLTHIRSMVPKDFLITCALDMHATITKQMIKNCNAFIGYKTAPHVDKLKTGERTAEVTRYALENNKRLTPVACRIPMIIPGEQAETRVDPMKTIIARLSEMEGSNNILTASFFTGFPWADSYENSTNVVIVTVGEKKKAVEAVLLTAKSIWEKREDFEFSTPAYTFEETLDRALASDKRPIFISDSGDNPTAGAPEDNTTIITALEDYRKIKNLNVKPLLAVIADQEAYKRCSKNLGRKITLTLGANMDSINSKPVAIECKPEKIIENYIDIEFPYNQDLVLADGGLFDIIISSKRVGITDPKMMEQFGIDIKKRKLFIVKSGYLFDKYQKLSAYSMLALTRGCTDEVLTRLPFKSIKRPIYPLDRDFTFTWEENITIG